MSPSPDHRYQQVKSDLEGGKTPQYVDPLMSQLVDALGGKGTSEVAYAYDIYRKLEHRAVVDAFLLSRAPQETISKVLEIPSGVLTVYEHLFMDRAVFRNRLETMTFASDYKGTAYGRELVRTAVSVGPEYLLWTFGATESEIDNRLVIRRTMIDSFFRGLAHKGNSITSHVAKESQRWWATAIRNAEILERVDPRATKAAYEELRIALDGKDETLKTEQSPVPVEEILH